MWWSWISFKNIKKIWWRLIFSLYKICINTHHSPSIRFQLKPWFFNSYSFIWASRFINFLMNIWKINYVFFTPNNIINKIILNSRIVCIIFCYGLIIICRVSNIARITLCIIPLILRRIFLRVWLVIWGSCLVCLVIGWVGDYCWTVGLVLRNSWAVCLWTVLGLIGLRICSVNQIRIVGNILSVVW